MNEDKNIGTGLLKPLDADESVEITVTVTDGEITGASFICSADEYLTACAETLCKVIKDKPVCDLFQMNANAVFYNTDFDLPRNRLYCASMVVTAAKRAAADWCRKNVIEVPRTEDGCNCY